MKNCPQVDVRVPSPGGKIGILPFGSLTLYVATRNKILQRIHLKLDDSIQTLRYIRGTLSDLTTELPTIPITL